MKPYRASIELTFMAADASQAASLLTRAKAGATGALSPSLSPRAAPENTVKLLTAKDIKGTPLADALAASKLPADPPPSLGVPPNTEDQPPLS